MPMTSPIFSPWGRAAHIVSAAHIDSDIDIDIADNVENSHGINDSATGNVGVIENNFNMCWVVVVVSV